VIVPILRNHLDRYAQPGDDGLVFVSPRGTRLRQRRSGVELGIRALPAGFIPPTRPNRLNQAADSRFPCAQQEWAEGSKSPPSSLRPRATTASREELARRLIPTAGRRATMGKQLRWSVRRAK
jgi:hypothetical protein